MKDTCKCEFVAYDFKEDLTLASKKCIRCDLLWEHPCDNYAKAYAKHVIEGVSDEEIDDFINKNEPFLAEFDEGGYLGTNEVSLKLYIKLFINKQLLKNIEQ